MGIEDVRKAAERLTANFWPTYRPTGKEELIETTGIVFADGRAVARDWLRANPADDGEAITRERCEAAGVIVVDCSQSSSADNWNFPGGHLVAYIQRKGLGENWWRMGCSPVPEPKNWGEARRLCKCLGIPLKETPHE